MRCRYEVLAALALISLHPLASFAQAGRVIFGPADSPQISALAAAQETFTMRPSVLSTSLSPYGAGPQTLDTTASCVLFPQGVTVPNCNLTIQWNGRNGSGGHVHNTSRPPGIFRTQNGVTGGSTGPGSPGMFTDNTGATGILGVTYTAPEASGITDLTVTGVALVNGVPTNFGPDQYTIGAKIEGLQLASVAGLQVSTASNMHDNNNGYATPAMIGALAVMVQRLAEELTRQGRPVPPVRVTALSLPLGGLFDFEVEWRPRHVSHRFGNDADIGMFGVTLPQRSELAIALARAGFRTPEPAASPANSTASHWHLRLP